MADDTHSDADESRHEARRQAKNETEAAGARAAPIELYYWPTPNGWKISIMLEECGLPYVVQPVDISKGEQFAPQFLAISPNNRIPAIVDPGGPGGRPISVFESGAILQYLGRKTGKFYPRDERARVAVEEWLFWQMGGLGPMAGQAVHFRRYAPEPIAYAVARYTDEVNRLYGVMNKRLAEREFLGRPLFDRRHGLRRLGPARRAAGPGPRAVSASQTLVRNHPRAAGRQARLRHPRRGGVDGRHARSQGARGVVRSARAVKRSTNLPGGEDKIQFARVQVCVLQMMLITQPLSSAVFGPVMVKEPL